MEKSTNERLDGNQPETSITKGEVLYCRSDLLQQSMDRLLWYGNWDSQSEAACGNNHKSNSITAKLFGELVKYEVNCGGGKFLWKATKL